MRDPTICFHNGAWFCGKGITKAANVPQKFFVGLDLPGSLRPIEKYGKGPTPMAAYESWAAANKRPLPVTRPLIQPKPA
jgi:hypothetical protein